MRHLLALACIAHWACQPVAVEFQEPPASRTFGELSYAVALSNARHEEFCSIDLEASLQANRSSIVSGVDDIMSESVLVDLPTLMTASVLPRLDEGQLDTMIAASARSLATLVDDELDPDRSGLAAVSHLLESDRILQDQHVFELARSLVAEPTFVGALHALATLADTPDPKQPSTSALTSLMRAVSQGLAADEPGSQCTGLDPRAAAQRLLATEGFVDHPVAGGFAWVAEVDGQGNALRVKPENEEPQYAPFGFGDGYDDQGRRLAAEGSLLYRYYDAKQTALAHGLRLAGEAAEAGIVFHTIKILDAALGPQQACESTDCVSYRADGVGLHRLMFTLLEVAKYDRPVELLQTWSDLVSQNPELAEDVLVSVGQIIKALEDADIAVEGAELVSLVEAFLPLVSDAFQIQGAGGVAMPRLLMQLMSTLGETAREFPEELAIAIDHTTLLKDDECSAAPPSPLSPQVDYSRHRFFFSQGIVVDNRSSVERSIELLDAADCGSVPFTGGKTVSHVIIDLMSRLAPDTVCNLIDNLLGLLGITGSVGEAVVNSTLYLLGCRNDGDVDAQDLFTLDDLAKSGALDFYLPIAKSFREAGQLPALIALFGVAAQDLRGDEDDSPNTTSALRPILPVISDVLHSGAVDPFFDLNELLVSIPAVNGQGTMGDVLVDSLARLLEDRFTINTALGPAQASLAAELVGALADMLTRVNEAGVSASLGDVSRHATGYLTRTTMEGSRLRLLDASLVPLLASSLEFLTQVADLSSEQYQCHLDQYQDDLKGWVQSPRLASFLRVALVLVDEEESAALQDFLVALLSPTRGDRSLPPFREILRMAAELIQSPQEFEAAADLMTATSAMLDPNRVGTDLITTLDALLQADTEGVFLRVIGSALGPSQTPASSSPLYRLYDAAEHYVSIDQDNACVLSPIETPGPEQLEESILASLRVLRDPDSVLNTMLDMLRKRRD